MKKKKSIFKGESRKSKVESNWLGKRKDSHFLQALKSQSFKASPADDDLQSEVDNLDELYRWADEFCDKLGERLDQIDSLNESFDALGSFLKEFYSYEKCTLTDAICEYADICENKIIEQNNQLKERIEMEITLLENYQRNDLMQTVELITDRQEKKRDFDHYQSKLQKLTQAIDKKSVQGKEVSEGEKEKKIRNEEKFVSAQAAWEAVKDSSVIKLNDMFKGRYSTLDYLLSSHARNEIEWSENVKEMYQHALSGIDIAKQNGSHILEAKEKQDGLIKSKTSMLGRTIKSKFLTDIGPPTGEAEFDTLLFKLDFIYTEIGELKAHLKNLSDGILAFTESGNDLAIRVKHYYSRPGPDHYEVARFYANTWERFAKTFTENMMNLGRSLFTDLANYEQNMINPIYLISKTYHEKKKAFEHYQVKVEKLRKKGSGKLKSNLEKLNQAENDYKGVSEKLLSSMRRTCTSRFEFLDLRLFDFVNQTNNFFQALSGSLAKIVPDLPDVEAPQSLPPLVVNKPPSQPEEVSVEEPEPDPADFTPAPPENPIAPPPAPPPGPPIAPNTADNDRRPLPPVPGQIGKRFPAKRRVSISDGASVPNTFAPPPRRSPLTHNSLPPKPNRDPQQVLESENKRRSSMGLPKVGANDQRRSSGLPRVSKSQRRLSKSELPAFEAKPPDIGGPPASPGSLPPPPPNKNAKPPPSPRVPDSISGPPPPPSAPQNVPKSPPADIPKPPAQPPAQPNDIPKPPAQPADVPKPPTKPPEAPAQQEAQVPTMSDFDAMFAGDDDFDLYAE